MVNDGWFMHNELYESGMKESRSPLSAMVSDQSYTRMHRTSGIANETMIDVSLCDERGPTIGTSHSAIDMEAG